MTTSPTQEQRISDLEERIAKLEAAAALFEEHRQAWIKLGEDIAKEWPDLAAKRRRNRSNDRRTAKTTTARCDNGQCGN